MKKWCGIIVVIVLLIFLSNFAVVIGISACTQCTAAVIYAIILFRLKTYRR